MNIRRFYSQHQPHQSNISSSGYHVLFVLFFWGGNCWLGSSQPLFFASQAGRPPLFILSVSPSCLPSSQAAQEGSYRHEAAVFIIHYDNQPAAASVPFPKFFGPTAKCKMRACWNNDVFCRLLLPAAVLKLQTVSFGLFLGCSLLNGGAAACFDQICVSLNEDIVLHEDRCHWGSLWFLSGFPVLCFSFFTWQRLL